MFRYPKSPAVNGGVLAQPPGGVPTAALAECTCPEFCERDHANE